MLPYWLLFLAAAALALTDWPRRRGGAFALLSSILIVVLLTIFIGLRYRVGGDWDSYEVFLVIANRYELFDALTLTDPAYALLNWIVGLMGGGVWWVNLICAALFSVALVRFALSLPLPGVALAAAVPSLVVVIAMGFTRQACAIACIMLAAQSYRGSFSLKWLFWLGLGMLFHKSMIFMIPIFMVAASRQVVLNLAIGALFALLMVVAFILDRLETLLTLYVEGEMKSGGAAPRVGLAVFAAMLFFTFLNKEEILGARLKLWRYMAIASLLLLPVYLVVESSTAVDRVAYLFLPFQLMVASTLPVLAARSPAIRYLLVVIIVAFNAALLGGWLLFAEHTRYWIPYRNVLFEPFLY